MRQPNICKACGTHFDASQPLPGLCPVCEDERQYIPEGGQGWISPEELASSRTTSIKSLTADLYEIKITPAFAIGQRALFITRPEGNILWDCIPMLDGDTIDWIRSKGGLRAIAFSHPHYYSNFSEWATQFDCPVYIHEADRPWVLQQSDHTYFWEGEEKALWDDLTIIRTGGHFEGSCLLHLEEVAAGTILCGDTLQVARSRKFISIMYSYPNLIPLPLREIILIKNKVLALKFDSMYGAFDFQNLPAGARQIFVDSMQRYV